MKDTADHLFETAPAQLTVRSEIIRFTSWSLLALVVLTVATILIAHRIANHQALEHASAEGASVAHEVAAPLIDGRARRDPSSSPELDLMLGSRIEAGSLRHIKLWDADGRIIWSDEKSLVGERFELEDDVAALFGTRDVVAEVSDLSKAENARERGQGDMLEVYVGTFDAEGTPLVFEAYLPVDRMQDDTEAIVAAFVPLVVAALMIFVAIVLPLAVSLARRGKQAQRGQTKMMRHALLAADLERRRVAADLHDSVIQDLAGLGYALPTLTKELRGDADMDATRAVLERATSIVRQDTAILRSMMVDLYPPDLENDGLRTAIEEIVQTETLDVEVAMPSDLALSHDAGRLAYRITREGLRNVVKHAGAHHALVEVVEADGRVLVRVQDDGSGPGSDPGVTTEGHLGLTLLRDTLIDVGGELELRCVEGGGTALVASFPTPVEPR